MDGCTIRAATLEDLDQIRAWLKKQDEDSVEDSFYCNIIMIERGLQNDTLMALVRDADSLPIAFCLSDKSIDIFEVKADLRRQGFGSYFARQVISKARDRDLIGLTGECAPAESLPFWKNMGFFPLSAPTDAKIACPLPKKHKLPEGSRHAIRIALEDAQHEELQPSLQCEAVWDGNCYQLAKDYVLHEPSGDKRLTIHCDDEAVFANKSKYVTEVGGERDCPWVRVRSITLAGPTPH